MSADGIAINGHCRRRRSFLDNVTVYTLLLAYSLHMNYTVGIRRELVNLEKRCPKCHCSGSKDTTMYPGVDIYLSIRDGTWLRLEL